MFTFFLADLDPEFDQVQGEILRKDPQLDLDQTFAFVSREAQQRMTMIGAEEDSIMVTQRQRGPQNSIGGSSQNKASRYHPENKCTHCGGDKHTHASCYELIGYPDWWDHSKAHHKNRSKSLNISFESDLVSRMVSATLVPTSASIATIGTKGHVLNTSSKKNTWIIDLGAIDHITFDHGQIASHTPSPQSVVSNAKGTPSFVIEGVLFLSLTPSIWIMC